MRTAHRAMTEHKTSALTVLKSIFRPLMAFCLRRSIPVNEIMEALKQALVEEAVEELKRTASERNVSRISVMTGLNRRDVHRIYRLGRESTPQQSWGARLLGQWEHDQRFTDYSGNCRPLTYQGRDNEFQMLAASISRDLSPAAMLFELQRIGAVKMQGELVVPKKLAHDQHWAPEKGFNLMLRDVDSLSRAVSENLLQPQKLRNLHSRTTYDNLSRKHLPAIRRWFLKQGAIFHKRARDFLSKYDKDLNPNLTEECNATVVFTTYSWTEGIGDMPEE